MIALTVSSLALVLSLSYVGTVSAAALDTSQHCGVGSIATSTTGRYTLNPNPWGGGSSGKACASFTSDNGKSVVWTATWDWGGGKNVKSYANIQLNDNIGKPLSAIKSIQSTWSWSQEASDGVVANVAYDFFTSPAANPGKKDNEIMIWLANFNTAPIHDLEYNSDGTPKPYSEVNIAGKNWKLYFGRNGEGTTVYSFLAGEVIKSFNGDIKPFFQFLCDDTGIKLNPKQLLTTAQGGTEACQGSATFTATYSMEIGL